MMVSLVVHLSSPELRDAASGERIMERLVVANGGPIASRQLGRQG
jgi:hypothetical protein